MSNDIKICPKCKKKEPEVSFRKRRAKCINCINEVRRAGHTRKMMIEHGLISNKDDYKHQWYLDNKNRISEESKIRYLGRRTERLALVRKNYYNADRVASNLIRSTKRRAKTDSIIFDLDKDFIDALYKQQNGKCALTGISFSFEKEETFRRPFAPSVDRINSKLGYTKDNVRLVCAVVNLALNEFGDQVFDKMCRSYVENTLRSL